MVNDVLGPGHLPGHHAQLRQAHGHPQGDHRGVGRSLPAHIHRNAVFGGILADHIDAAQDRHAAGIVKILHVLVHAVGGRGILDQIVCADAEEIGFLGQQVAQLHGGRGFDHDAHGNLIVEGDVLRPQLVLRLLQHLLGAAQLLDAGDHGEHDSSLAVCAGPQDSPQLHQEDIRVTQAEPDGAVAQEGIALLGQVHVGRLFVAADVQGADDDLVAVGALDHRAVILKLLLLGGIAVALHIDELRAVKAHAVAGVQNVQLAAVLPVADVGAHAHVPAVQGSGGLAQHGVVGVRHGLLLFQGLLKALRLLPVGGYDHLTAAVEHNAPARQRRSCPLPDAPHRPGR